jgi:hypothetical protein
LLHCDNKIRIGLMGRCTQPAARWRHSGAFLAPCYAQGLIIDVTGRFDANGRGFQNNNHVGNIPTEVGGLGQWLEVLRMEGNDFEGILPPGLETMTRMVELYVMK